MTEPSSLRIGKLRFKSTDAAVTHYLARERNLKKGPLRKGAVFDELSSLFLTYCECCEKWGLDSRAIIAFSLDEGDSHNEEAQTADTRYLVHFLRMPSRAFSLRQAVSTIAKAAETEQK